jgi:hypothetical protein
MGFSNKSIDIVERLRECADLDESEYGEPGVVAMTREAADTIESLRAALAKIADWDSSWGPFPENNESWREAVQATKTGA